MHELYKALAEIESLKQVDSKSLDKQPSVKSMKQASEEQKQDNEE